jgi:hypothetical protein
MAWYLELLIGRITGLPEKWISLAGFRKPPSAWCCKSRRINQGKMPVSGFRKQTILELLQWAQLCQIFRSSAFQHSSNMFGCLLETPGNGVLTSLAHRF